MLYPGQPVTAISGDTTYLCIVLEPCDNNLRIPVNVVARIDDDGDLTVLDCPSKRTWFIDANSTDYAEELFIEYSRLTSTALPDCSKEEILQYSIKGRMI